MNVVAEKLKRYNYKDDQGHPLENCVDYHTLLEMADYAMHIHANNNEDDTLDDAAKVLQRQVKDNPVSEVER